MYKSFKSMNDSFVNVQTYSQSTSKKQDTSPKSNSNSIRSCCGK